MPEATMIILDNSDYSINGDYQPTRWLSQLDAAGLLIQAKLEQNHQNCMGIALSGGKHVEIVCTPSNDITKVTSFLYGIKQHGKQQLSVALQTSALALKHRSDQMLSQRIVCFVASTLNDNQEELKLICKKLKKNNISLDIVALGDLSQQQRNTLTVMHEAVKSDKGSELVFVQPEGNVSDALFTTSILGAEPAAAPMINQAEDPELLMALQLSLQQEEQRQAAAGQQGGARQGGGEQEELQQRALQLAMQEQKKQQDKKQDENGGNKEQ